MNNHHVEKSRRSKKKRRPSRNGTKRVTVVAFGLVCLSLLLLIEASIFQSQDQKFPLSYVAIMLGVVIESRRMLQSWTSIIWCQTGAMLFGLFILVAMRTESYDLFEQLVKILPYLVLTAYVLLSTLVNRDKATVKLNEGTTAILSLGLIYWIFDHGFLQNSSLRPAGIILVAIVILLSSLAVINAMVNIELTERFRFALSLWSAAILSVLAIDNIISLHSSAPTASAIEWNVQLFYVLRLCLLGACSMYIMQNFIMIIRLLPERKYMPLSEYWEQLKVLKSLHVGRYLDSQVNLWSGMIFCFVAGSIFFMNYCYQFTNRSTLVWIILLATEYLWNRSQTLKAKLNSANTLFPS